MVADILGYKEKMREAHLKDNEQEALKELYDILEKAYLELNDPSGKKWKLKTFSDNLIVGYRYIGSGGGAFEFAQACFNIGHFQLELTLNGLFIRGGIGVGSIHIGERIIFGYILEELSKAEKLAKNPRIILLKSAMEYIKTHPENLVNTEFMDIIKDDIDAKYINYLYPLRYPNDTRRSEAVNQHKHFIEKNLNKYKHYPEYYGIYEKYVWVANYHNKFCNESSYYNDSSFMINVP